MDQIEGNIGDDSHTNAIGKDIKQDVHTTNVNVYPKSEKLQQKRKPTRNPVSATVEFELRRIVAQAEIRIDSMEAMVKRNERISENEFEDLRREMRKMREATRTLDGQGILSTPTSVADPEMVKLANERYGQIVGLIKLGMILLGICVIVLLVILLWPVLSGA